MSALWKTSPHELTTRICTASQAISPRRRMPVVGLASRFLDVIIMVNR